MTDLREWLPKAVDAIQAWESGFGEFEAHPSTEVPDSELASAFERLVERLADNYPYGHPRYVGQILKPPHPAAILGYVTAMLINPNNHALDGGPATAAMEKEVVSKLAAMFGLPQHLGHLTSSGTIANLEALWVARELHPGKKVAYSADAHYTHSRMCALIGVEGASIETDERGRMDLSALERALSSGDIGTVVATVGTTGLGSLDPLPEIVELARHHGARVHVDAAYGGFYALIADDSEDGVESGPFRALADADSIVVDPHKHGLQPYGCGAVLFRDPSVGRLYVHDSPYTYFSSTELHLGEISLECSRAGAAAAALWMTLEVLPLTDEGLGQVLRANRRGAIAWHELLGTSRSLVPYQAPELDIVSYFPRLPTLSAIAEASQELFVLAGSGAPVEQIHLATFNVTADAMGKRHDVTLDGEQGRILRSTVLKPESEYAIRGIHRRLEELAGENIAARL
ncbi:pyridoxal phosphate-dependent decarboxylase family protein [Modestobacter sp. VKM Ac-2978]|uniref:pyridoxal phosphate-dependent decarboxylase family protein n=1 Tax=Modestobacter sp. VKM Ac-2978 TaxID=3004132 RepID=UPI0022AA3BE9|nr:aminotransferase class I/II-fold pyridoxal phosphate-dependent enzyme [Modestobacter sp. VKM Ac-2978]MCZ2849859.1 aminotransferase class V-fold PLP-dependent enzyme [Modestobacter sp. VKM Ac-2978]